MLDKYIYKCIIFICSCTISCSQPSNCVWRQQDNSWWMAFIWRGLWKCRAWGSAPTVEEFEGDVNSYSNITAIDTITHGYFQAPTPVQIKKEALDSEEPDVIRIEGKRKWSCPQCGFVKGSKNGCNAHIRVTHSKKALFWGNSYPQSLYFKDPSLKFVAWTFDQLFTGPRFKVQGLSAGHEVWWASNKLKLVILYSPVSCSKSYERW